MKKSLVFAGMMVLLCGMMGCGSSADGLVKEEIKTMNEMADAMEKKDEAKVKELQKKLEETNKKLEGLKLTEEEKKKVIEANKDELAKAATRVMTAGFGKAMGDFGKAFQGQMPPKMPGTP